LGAPFELYAEEAEFTGDFSEALQNMDRAVALEPDRFQLRAERWRKMVRLGERDTVLRALSELEQARSDRAFEAMWPVYVNALAETYVMGFFRTNQSTQLVNNFAPELQSDGELARMITRVRRESS
jgi:hypothetical protein